MGLAGLNKVVVNRVCGLDCSTNSVAFAIMEKGTPISCGEIFFEGATPFERLKDARRKVRALVEAGTFDGVELILIESAIMVHNVQTAIDLAYVFGAIISELSEVCKDLRKVAPISWQTGIGVPNLKKEEREAIQKEFPGKTKSWYQKKGREIRKARILKISRQYFDIAGGSDNVGDAVGIALFASQTLTK